MRKLMLVAGLVTTAVGFASPASARDRTGF